MIKLTFWGAARTVTGSMHHVETGGKRFLLDCGMYQGRRQEAFERNSNFPFPPFDIEAVILSHAHIDHSGNLPNLVHQGFRGPIYTTSATIDLCLAMLADSAYLQEKDAEFCNRRRTHRKIDRPGRPGMHAALHRRRRGKHVSAIPAGEARRMQTATGRSAI